MRCVTQKQDRRGGFTFEFFTAKGKTFLFLRGTRKKRGQVRF